MSYCEKVMTLTEHHARLSEIIDGLAYFNQYPPLTRGEAVQLEVLIDLHNNLIDIIIELENELYADGNN